MDIINAESLQVLLERLSLRAASAGHLALIAAQRLGASLHQLLNALRALEPERIQALYIQLVAVQSCFFGLKALSSPSEYRVEGKRAHNFQSMIYEYFGGFRFGLGMFFLVSSDMKNSALLCLCISLGRVVGRLVGMASQGEQKIDYTYLLRHVAESALCGYLVKAQRKTLALTN